MLEGFYGLVYLSAVLRFVALTGTQAKCPVQLNPNSVVVEYGGSVAVNCTASVTHYGMGWEADEGGVYKTSASVITWKVSDLREWNIKPICYINYDITHETQCLVELPVTVYKTPDSVFISIVNHRGPVIEGKQYELQCDVVDVAPVQNLIVKWYKGQTLLNQTTFTDTSITPVNEVSTLLIRPDRADDGARYRCEAELDLGAEGPRPPLTKTSKPVNAIVYFIKKSQELDGAVEGVGLKSRERRVCRIAFEEYLSIWMKIATTNPELLMGSEYSDEFIKCTERCAHQSNGNKIHNLVPAQHNIPVRKLPKKDTKAKCMRVERMRRLYMQCKAPDQLTSQIPGPDEQEHWEREMDELVEWTHSLSMKEFDDL